MDRYIIVESAHAFKRTNEKVLPDKVIFDAVIQTAEEKNRNGRVYHKKALDDALKAKMNYMENSRGFVGELDHPVITSSDKTVVDMRLSNVLWERVSHVITKWWWEGNELWATIESTLNGKGPEIVKIIKDNIPLGFSLRALAQGNTMDNSGVTQISNIDYLVAYDAVTTPSHAVATMRKLNEERFYNITESLNLNFLKQDNIDNNISKVLSLLEKWG